MIKLHDKSFMDACPAPGSCDQAWAPVLYGDTDADRHQRGPGLIVRRGRCRLCGHTVTIASMSVEVAQTPVSPMRVAALDETNLPMGGTVLQLKVVDDHFDGEAKLARPL